MISIIIGLIGSALGVIGVVTTGVLCFVGGYHMADRSICQSGYLNEKVALSKYEISEPLLDANKFIDMNEYCFRLKNLNVTSSPTENANILVETKGKVKNGIGKVGSSGKKLVRKYAWECVKIASPV